MGLIDKDALVAEIERRTDELWALIPDGEKVLGNKHTKEDAFNLGKYTALESLDKFINTLEVKEVDLEKSHKGISVGDVTPIEDEDPAAEYSFNTPSELFHQLTTEQQKLWKKEIEQAYNTGMVENKR